MCFMNPINAFLQLMQYQFYHLRLPEDVYFSEEPQVVRWDPLRKQWSLDGFTDHNFNEGMIQ